MASNDLEMPAGDTKIITVIVKDASGNLVDISNAGIKWQLAKHVGSTPLVMKSTGFGITVTDGPNGIFEILIRSNDTDTLGGKEYYHEAEITLVDGTVSTIISGDVIITKTLIRSSGFEAYTEGNDSVSSNSSII